ncbi:MAG: hypothetical protein JSW61_13475 [Candidatus Thorarchaeota archaeon]|nr:MAG: hypothetical protein JSW61_13475 [Candidatus Thorarchaeota archaeon]
MTLEKIKREFVDYMERSRATEPYPRKFFGCLISIIIETEPTSQERIMELTGYSQAAVSLILQRIQLVMPLKTTRKLGDRKHYYAYEGTLEGFILDLWQRRLEAQAIDPVLVETMLQKVRKKVDNDHVFVRFLDYLQNVQLYMILVQEMRNAAIETFRHASDTGSFDTLSLQDAEVLEKGTLADFLSIFRAASLESDINDSCYEDALEDYTLLKSEYFTSIKTNLPSLYSQAVANQIVVLHAVMLDGCTTQERLEKSTLLPRSTISEVLAQSVRAGIVEVVKKEGSRTKLYRSRISFVGFMLNYYDRLERQVSEGTARISEFIQSTRKIRPQTSDTKKFLDTLKRLEKAYSFTLRFSESSKVEMVTRLREEYARGFEFV